MLTSTPEFRAVLRMLHDSGFEVTPIWLEKHMDLYHEGKRKLVLEQMLDRSSPTPKAVVYMVSMVSAAKQGRASDVHDQVRRRTTGRHNALNRYAVHIGSMLN